MLLQGAADGSLELRAESDGSRLLKGRFPYNSLATLSDGGRRGRPRKERFAPGAFRYSVKAQSPINLLIGHDFGKPLAARNTGTLELTDTDEALTFEARITPEVAETSFARDALALLQAGLAVGISPGFRIPPERTVENAETIEDEDPAEGEAIIRTINEAILRELSLVTNPAYPEAQVEARSWDAAQPARIARPPMLWFYR
ncbi:HK97 family phage prohead protease [uncultured Salinisphaera sp.]|uniref:HK97 family phage prohead protease n=1 Tax=uncultured Salinisphaera sp. TaxID=359372 RepID=UPI0032B271C6